ncbi:GCG_CRPN prefix-to-repeats domain-containing protein [Enterovirga rhinocerotis]|uniref:Uncharacterized protein n=1 Tax=Enterovirga rhinocerotis TaxID=1339210 RepID=A0A4R7C729_9HYPH|nr:hypothetical protein [Enterovirga rhinocerotis]TDR93045.1 hypothetical protein EV668_0293 [Enterovirga rhinocerotis]
MHGRLVSLLAAVGLASLSSAALAMPIPPSPIGASASDISPLVVRVANGCGPDGYRGPYGACHSYGTGPYPGGYFGPFHNAWNWNGCPPGYWRGPWGHCRDTPFHGRLPGGGWK